jgi:hypothetical protein
MRLVPGLVVSLVLIGACSSSRAESAKTTATVDEPWSHAYSGAPDGWWKNWDSSLGGKAPFGVGTRLEIEYVGPHGMRQSRVLEVRSVTPQPQGAFEVVLESPEGSVRSSVPPSLTYSPGAVGFLTTRNEKLLSVTVPAGTFAAGRLWTSERNGSLVYERDDWVVPDLPIPVQSWSRPVSAKELYNPPADDSVPEGTLLTRLVRIEKK